jgi:hypothetical protein
MIVKNRMMKPQNVRKWAAPGTDHLSSLRWPNTSVAWELRSLPTCSRAASNRSGAGWPAAPSRYSHHTRRPTIANATTVKTRPMMMRRATADLL